MIRTTVFLLVFAALTGGCSAQVSVSRGSSVVVDSEIVRSIQAAGGRVYIGRSGSVIVNNREVDADSMPRATRRRVRADFERGAFARIMVTTPVDVPVVTLASRDDRVHVGGSVLAATAIEIDAFFDASSRDVRGRDLRFRVGPSAYDCAYAVVDGREGILGVCIERVSVALPARADAQVYVNGIPASPSVAVDRQVLLEALQDSPSDFDRQRISHRFAQFMASETIPEGLFEAILGTFSGDYERKEATQILVGHVQGDIAGDTIVRLMGQYRSDYDREMALRSLARHGAAMDGGHARSILLSFHSDHDRKQAAEGLIRAGRLTLAAEEIPGLLRIFGSDFSRREALGSFLSAVAGSLSLGQTVGILGPFTSDYDRQEACEALSRRLDRASVDAAGLAALSRLFRSDYDRGRCTDAIVGR